MLAFAQSSNINLPERLTRHHVRMKNVFPLIPRVPGVGLELNKEQARKHCVA